MIRYIKQDGKPDPDAPLTFADFDYQADNDEPAQNLSWRYYAVIVLYALAIGALFASPILLGLTLT